MVKALVLYHSQEFGNTAVMAEALAEGLKTAGCEVDLFNTNDKRFDLTEFPKYECVAFGSPNYYGYVAGGLKTFLDDHYIQDVRKGLKGIKGKPYALFYSHGGGTDVKSVMEDLFKRVGTQIGKTVGSYGKPTAEVLKQCRILAKKLAGSVS